MELKNPFGLKDGKLIHISEVTEMGKNCGCLCPSCKTQLSAKLGSGKRVPHFSHIGIECKNSIQSGLHIFAKEVLERNKKIRLPKVFIKNSFYYQSIEDFDNPRYNFEQNTSGYDSCEEIQISKETLMDFDHVEIEKRLDDIIPDIVLYKNGIPLIIEIAVTHYAEENKIDKIRAQNISTIEIDLGNAFNYYSFDRKEVERVIIEKVDNKIWLYNRKAENKKKELVILNQKVLPEYKKRKEYELNESAKLFINYRVKSENKERERLKELVRIEDLKREKEKLILQFANDAEADQNWIELSSRMQISISSVPEFVNCKVFGELSFGCDRRIWQCSIFEHFILNKMNTILKFYDVYHWVENYSGLPINPVLNYNNKEFGSVYDAILIYLLTLKAKGFLLQNYNNFGFYSEFKVVHDKFSLPAND